MDMELLTEWSERHEGEHLQFKRIAEKDRLHSRPDLCGMLLLAKICPGDTDLITSAEHDQVWFGVDQDAEMTEEQFVYLLRCGIIWDSDGGFFKFI
jgi:hypothetical protein